LGATGPSAYDCSGIVWRAMKNLNMYSGPRFTTATFEIQCSEFITRVDTPAVNDVVLWRSGHMGVYSGNGQVYAAKSSRSGIGFQSATDPIRGSRPIYYRWTVPASQRRNTAVDRRLS
jgi:cell wall-associated NlpC family hydrolase